MKSLKSPLPSERVFVLDVTVVWWPLPGGRAQAEGRFPFHGAGSVRPQLLISSPHYPAVSFKGLDWKTSS